MRQETKAQKRILVIDDDPAYRRRIKRLLGSEGYQVFQAGSGRQGLRQIHSHEPDVVILEAVMPEMDGWQTCRLIRQVSRVPVIMLTEKAKGEEDIVRGLESGADDYFFKSVTHQELLARLGAVLRLAQRALGKEAIQAGSHRPNFNDPLMPDL